MQIFLVKTRSVNRLSPLNFAKSGNFEYSSARFFRLTAYLMCMSILRTLQWASFLSFSRKLVQKLYMYSKLHQTWGMEEQFSFIFIMVIRRVFCSRVELISVLRSSQENLFPYFSYRFYIVGFLKSSHKENFILFQVERN